ncbi:MAG: M20/M25/M40 family metallo-hydrolase [bacterium]|nr:M20/M25/M40 family metallo-hydrolase [bacterium]
MMDSYLKQLPGCVDVIKGMKEIILTNIVLLGQTPCTPVKGDRPVNYPRTDVFLERVREGNGNECAVDTYGNPYAVVPGSVPTQPPIFLVSHMDTTYDEGKCGDLLYSVTEDAVIGPGLLDNSLGVGVLMSLPRIFKALGLEFRSDIVLFGLTESLRQHNLKSIRDILSAWKKPIRSAICVEGGERGRLNYFSNCTVRVEVICDIPKEIGWHDPNGVNAIIVINEVINRLLEIPLPRRPSTDIVIGQFKSGAKYGKVPLWARLGFEVRSQSDRMVEQVLDQVDDICGNVSHTTGVQLQLNRISSVKAAKLAYHHPLVQTAKSVMETLEIQPRFESSQSELSVFLSHNIPAVTLGVAHGENYNKEDEMAEIDSIFKGIAQVVGLVAAIDQGVCDG